MTLAPVEQFEASPTAIAETERQLREAGRQGCERWVLWSGVQDGRRFRVRTVHVPAQTAYRLKSGLCVKVDGAALHELNVWLLEHEERLAVQIHAHPDSAYHSDTDDSFSIVTRLGGLSLVAANFCRRGLLSRGTAAYRLTPDGWQRTRSHASALVVVR